MTMEDGSMAVPRCSFENSSIIMMMENDITTPANRWASPRRCAIAAPTIMMAKKEATRRMTSIHSELEAVADPAYRRFQTKLIPTVDPERVLGVRVPVLRTYAKHLQRERPEIADAFLRSLPHETYDENMLHGILLNELPSYDACVSALDAFLPHVDNWAVCDVLAPRAFRKRPPHLLEQAKRWIASSHPYTVRFGVGVLMRQYLDDGFSVDHLRTVAAIDSEDYYVRMMIAWYFATALTKQWDATIPLIEEGALPLWTHNKAIQKARESYRVPADRKSILASLKRPTR